MHVDKVLTNLVIVWSSPRITVVRHSVEAPINPTALPPIPSTVRYRNQQIEYPELFGTGKKESMTPKKTINNLLLLVDATSFSTNRAAAEALPIHHSSLSNHSMREKTHKHLVYRPHHILYSLWK